MHGRFATDTEVETWQHDGWALLEGLISTEEVDAAVEDLADVFPSAEEYHADPEAARDRWLGRPPPARDAFVWPDDGPGFRPEQHRWRSEFPLPGSGALNRLCVHPAIVDFMERAMETRDLRCYQAQVSAKFTGEANYEQPMHTDRNHSWLPPRMDPPWWHAESFLYLCDVDAGNAPTHLVPLSAAGDRTPTVPLFMPRQDPELYGAEIAAPGPRGSLLVYRPDVFHRGVDLTAPGGARFLLNVSYKVSGQDWIGFHSAQSRATAPEWVQFVEGSTPRELELFGFPEPGHPIWNATLLEQTAERYPRLDLSPWKAALGE